LGFGKPDERVMGALSALGVKPEEAWMAGDNLEFDAAAPDSVGRLDRPAGRAAWRSAVKPHYIVCRWLNCGRLTPAFDALRYDAATSTGPRPK
jgi:FMN phosphatase YigB (HAD superfamily)